MIKILICGDYAPRDRVQNLLEAENYENVFGEIVNYTSKADYSIVNLEAPIVVSNAEPIKKCGPNLKCTPKAVKALKYAGFNMVTLANNHFYDYGDEGVCDTLEVCNAENIDVVGGGRCIEEASKILYKEINGVKIAFINCCEKEFSIATDNKGGANHLNPIKQYYLIQEAKKEANKIILIVHGGHEYYPLPSMRMKETYRFFIDAGADVVINHHQHCYSGYEVYNSKPIFYGLGNFCFDSDKMRNLSWNEGYMVMLNIGKDISFEVIPYVQGNEFPGVHIISKQEKDAFFCNISKLNDIISNDECLVSEWNLFMQKTTRGYQLLVEPYDDRILSSLYVRKLLPSLISEKKRLRILNYLQCESHIDRLIYAINLGLKK